MYKTLKKIVATALVAIIAFSYLQILGVYAKEVYATNSKLEEQGISTNNSNVEFDAYFDVEGKAAHTATKTISEENKIYTKINVKNAGYLKEAQIEIQGIQEEKGVSNKSANFVVQKVENEICQSIEQNVIKLNKISSGSETILELPISFVQNEIIDVNSFSAENEIKLTATYVDGNGDEKKIQKTIKVELNWKEEVEAQITQELTRYVPYTIGDKKGIILQTSVKAGVLENKLPIKQAKIEIQAPAINGNYPEQIKITAKTQGTEGKQKTLKEEEYKYNKETGKIEITSQNNIKEDGTINWRKQEQDQHIITYLYNAQTLETIKPEGIKIALEAKAQIEAYGNEQKILEIEMSKEEKTLTEKINDIVTVQTQATQSVSKGFLYSNPKSAQEEKHETEYTQKVTINASYVDLIDKLSLKTEADKLIKTNDTLETATNKTYIKEIQLKREEYINLLGEEGKILILTKEGITLTQITKETETDEQGNITIDISEIGIDNIEIETTKPEIEGTLEITLNKAIKTDANIANAQNYKGIRVGAKLDTIKEATSIVVQEANTDIALVEPVSKIDMQIGTTTLSTIVENKNVEIKAILDTSNSSFALYKNPVIEIVLPEYVEKMSINSVKTYFNEELKIANYEIVSGKTIKIILAGEQTKYDIGLVSRGLNIVIDANIWARKLTPTITSEIKMYVQHENNNIYEKVEGAKGVVAQQIQFVAPVGIVAANSISNYNSRNEEMLLVGGETKRATLDVLSKAKLATVEHIIINNSSSPINNVAILGRTISKGSKNIQTGEDLGATFDAPMKSGIAVEGIESSNITIYYSENINATKDLTNAQNGWTTQVQDLSKIKSYLVVLNNYQMEIGTVLSLKYNTEIPEQLSRNQYGYATYAVYYSNAYARTMSEENLVAPLAELSTGEGPEVKVELSANVQAGAEVQEGQIIKYTAKITNTGKTVAEGPIVGINIPEGTSYIQYVEGLNGQKDSYEEIPSRRRMTKSFTKLEPGASGTLEVEVKVDELDIIESEEGDKKVLRDIKATAFGTVLNLDSVANSNEFINKAVEGYITVKMTTEPGRATTLNENKILKYEVEIQNINTKSVKNLVVKGKLPEGLIFKDAYYINNMSKNSGRYDEKTGELTYTIGELSGNSKLLVYLEGTVDEKKHNTTEIKNTIQVSCVTPENKTLEMSTNETTNKVKIEKAELTAKLTSDIPEGNLQEGERLTYMLELANTGTKTLKNIRIVDILPSILEYRSSKYVVDGMESEVESSVTKDINIVASLPAGTVLKYTLVVEVGELGNQESAQVKNSFKIFHEELEAFSTNELTHTIIKSNNDPNNPNNPNNPTGIQRRIQGQVWIDQNEDGKKDENETKVSGIEVMLFDYATGSALINAAGDIIVVKTDENGRYEFTNLPAGQYAVIFLYDTANYSSTAYRKEGIDAMLNSDAIDSKIAINNVERTAAVTEKIDLTAGNVYNIDLGLITDKKFDLKLDKTVASITVQNQTGTAKYEYNNKLAKRDLTGRYIDNTTIVVEYKIAVTNEGAIEGYAKKIVDYIPSNFKFNAELNRDWYTLESGSVCSSSLANTKILPGETKEITLVLTKAVKESDLTLITNTAEILEAYNDLGIADVDSTPGNKQSNEDDISTADILLTVRTGAQTILFISLTLGIIAVIGIGIYFINKKVIRKIK